MDQIQLEPTWIGNFRIRFNLINFENIIIVHNFRQINKFNLVIKTIILI